jgi:hypothetical protein
MSSTADRVLHNDVLAQLVSESEIRGLLARYCRAVDRLDEALLRSLVYPDAAIDYGEDFFQGSGTDFIPWILGHARAMRRTQHAISATLIDVAGNVALCESYGQAVHILEDNGVLVELTSGNRYLDRMEQREDGIWRIAKRRVVVDWLRRLGADERLLEGLRVTVGARDKTDPLYRFMASERIQRKPERTVR